MYGLLCFPEACYRIMRNPGFCRSVGGDASVARTTDDMGIANPVAATMATPTGLSPTQRPSQNPYAQPPPLAQPLAPLAVATTTGTGPLAGPMAMAQQSFMQQLQENNPAFRQPNRILVRPNLETTRLWFQKGLAELEVLGMWLADELDRHFTQSVILVPEEFVCGIASVGNQGLEEIRRYTECEAIFQTEDEMYAHQVSERRLNFSGSIQSITRGMQLVVTVMGLIFRCKKKQSSFC